MFVVWSACLLSSQIFVVRRVGDENVGWNEGVGGTAYNHSRTASNVGVLFTCLFGTIVWRSKGIN